MPPPASWGGPSPVRPRQSVGFRRRRGAWGCRGRQTVMRPNEVCVRNRYMPQTLYTSSILGPSMNYPNPFGDFAFGEVVETVLPDLVLSFAFFSALGHAVPGKRFDHQRSAVAASGPVGLALSIGMVWWVTCGGSPKPASLASFPCPGGLADPAVTGRSTSCTFSRCRRGRGRSDRPCP
jgi:hypothetical protein